MEWKDTTAPVTSRDEPVKHNFAKKNGCRQRLEGYLSCQQRLALAVA
jgi:hypothetical protein